MITKKLQPIKISSLNIHLSFILLILLSVYIGFADKVIIVYLITGLHELAHILTARRLKVGVEAIDILPFGVTMKIKNDTLKNPDDEIKIALSGPLLNIALAYISYGVIHGAYREYVIATSLVIGLFNLLPVLPLDGGRILRALLVKRTGYIRAMGITLLISKVSAVILILCGAAILYISKFNFSVMLTGAFLIANITEEKKRSDLIIMKDILYSRQKLFAEVKPDGGIIVAGTNDKASNILKKLTYDKYYMIDVIDEGMRLVKTITETELIEKVARYGIYVNMKKIVEF